MTSWETYRLGDVCSRLRSGKGIPASEVSTCGKFAVVGGNGVRGYTDASNFNGQCVVVGRQGAYCGNVRYFDGEFYMTEHAVVIVGNELADTHFLAYLLSTMHLGQLSAQSAQPGLSVQTLSKLEISLPPLEEQRRIAGILSAIDDKIENNRRINANLELQAQALYKQWFVDFEFPHEEGKPYKSSGGKMVDSELGQIPEGWSVIGYCDAVDIKGGGTPPTNNPEFWNGSIPFFTPKDVPSDCFAIHTEKSITEAGLSNCNSKLYAKDTVFITARGTVGKVVMAGCSMAMNQTNYALIGKNELSQYFVYLLTIALVDRLLKKANGAVFNAITTRDFEGEQIVHPTNFVLGKFIDIISPLYQQVLSIAKENETLATLRDTLLPKLMNGEIKTE